MLLRQVFFIYSFKSALFYTVRFLSLTEEDKQRLYVNYIKTSQNDIIEQTKC